MQDNHSLPYSFSIKDIKKDPECENAEKEGFRKWLKNERKTRLSEDTIDSRVSNIGRLQKTFGCLTDLYSKDKLEAALKYLRDLRANYPMTPEFANSGFTIEVNGDVYNGISTLVSALQLFIHYQEWKKRANESTSIQNPSSELLNFNIEEVLDNFTPKEKKTKYSRSEVKNLIQIPLLNELENQLPNWEWNQEKVLAEFPEEFGKINDRIDIYGKYDDVVCIIEIDTCRSDQITKKFVSRLACSLDKKLIYGVVAYPNEHVSYEAEKKEAEKYFKFVENILNRLSDNECPKLFVKGLLYD